MQHGWRGGCRQGRNIGRDLGFRLTRTFLFANHHPQPHALPTQQVRPGLEEIVVDPTHLPRKHEHDEQGPRATGYRRLITGYRLQATHTLSIVRSARAVTVVCTSLPKTSEYSARLWELGSQVRRVLCFEKGTLFP